MQAAYIAFGDELLKGNRLNTHTLKISRALNKKGISLDLILTLPDSEELWVQEQVSKVLTKASYVICTGGLGPTGGDKTRSIFSTLYKKPLQTDEAYAKTVRERFGSDYPNTPVSSIPKGARLLPNAIGSACGFVLDRLSPFSQTTLLALPGPTDEMEDMLDHNLNVFPSKIGPKAIVQRFFLFVGLEYPVDEFFNSHSRDFPSVNMRVYPSYGYVEVILSSNDVSAIQKMNSLLLSHFPLSYKLEAEATSFEEFIMLRLQEKKLTLACAESCTGGKIASLLTLIPGASQNFFGSAVVYSDQSKHALLHIDEKLIQTYTSVSEEVGKALALSCKALYATSLGLSAVGYFGPTGGTEKTPCGTVILSLAQDQVYQKRVVVQGNRAACQNKASLFALSFLAEKVLIG